MASPLLGLSKTIGKAMKGVFLDATLTRMLPGSTQPPYTAYDPGPPTPRDYPCKAIAEVYGTFTRGQGLVAATDMKVDILVYSLSVQPAPLDRIVIPSIGFSGQIVPGDTPGTPSVSTDPAKAIWSCRTAT